MNIKTICLLLLIVWGASIQSNAQGTYGIFGKKTVDAVTDTLSKDINGLKKDVLIYLSDSLSKTANKAAIGILDSVIRILGDDKNQKRINTLMDGLIKNSVGSTRQELITFKDSLLDTKFRKQLGSTLQIIMNDMVVNPSERLIDYATGDQTREHLDKLLRMIVPATLNDSAIKRVNDLRTALLGDAMKKDISGLVDTALGTVNSRLKGDLGTNLNKAVAQNTKTVGVEIKDIILYACIAILILGLIFYFLYSRMMKKKNDMLFTLSNSIEEFRKDDGTPNQANFHKLTSEIRENMVRMQLEEDMKNFLIKKNINKPSDYN